MVETLLTLAGLTVLSVVAFASYSHVSAKSKVSDESENLRELSSNVENSFGLLGNFAGVSANAIVRDGLAPTRLTRGEGWLTNAWAGAVTVEPYTVTRFGDGFSIVHHQVPARSCADFVAVNARDPWDIQVSDVSVIRNHGGRLDLQALTDACADGDGRIRFVFHTGLVAGAAVGASPLQLPPTPTSTTLPGSPPLGGPVGSAGPVDPAAPVGPINSAPSLPPPPSAAVAPPTATPVVPVTPPAPPATPPLPPPTTVAACVESSENRTMNCPAGSVGQAFQSRRHHCGPDPSVYEAWAGATTAGPWTDISNTCTPCPGPESRTLACPTGQLGAIQEQRTFVCSGSGSWGAWTLTSNTCAPACVLPTPSTQTDTETRSASQTAACPAGQVGEIVQSRQEQRTRARSAYCPAPTGPFAWNGWSGWSAWAATTPWATVSDTCTPITGPSCSWELDVYSLAPNFGNLDGETVSYNDGLGGGCDASWGGRSGITDQSSFNACKDSIPSQPLNAGAYYALSEYTNWGGGMENNFGYRASCSSRWEWVLTGESIGGCGAQGGGSGGTICVSSQGDGNGYGCGGQVCDAAHDGVTYASGYAERWDAPWPDCDYQVFTCMEVNP